MSEIKHCEHWFAGSDECHRCGHFPMMERLAYVVGMGPKPHVPPCVETALPCPDRETWRDKLSEAAAP